jgi:tetratricopeptide (TPR) repeat protein
LALGALLLVNPKPIQDLVFYNLALVYDRMGNTAKAAQNYRNAYSASPNDFLSRINLGNAYIALEKYDEAEKAFDRAFAINPENVEALHNKAILLAMKKQYREALEVNERVLQLAPDWPPAIRFRERLNQIQKEK